MDKVAFITMDVESYFDTSCVKEKISPYNINAEYSCVEEISRFEDLLNKYNCKGTFFLTGSFLESCSPYIKRLKDNGHEIALHCNNHISPLNQTIQEFTADINTAAELIQNQIGVKPLGYRAPCFGIDEERLTVIKKNFLYDSSFMNTTLSIYNGNINLSSYKKINDSVYKKNGFLELVPSTVKFFHKTYPVSGGAYLRLPPGFFINHLLKKYLKHADSYVFYVHPFEISPRKLPVPEKATFAEKIFLKHGRKRYYKRIEKILKLLKRYGFSFVTPLDFIEK